MNGRKLLAALLILFGGVMLMDNIIPRTWLPGGLGSLFWPGLLVVVGLTLIIRPEILSPQGVKYRPIANVTRQGAWDVADEEIRMFVGDLDYDYTAATIPDGTTRMRITAFVPDVDIRVSTDIGLRIVTTAFVTDSRFNGDKKDYVMTGMNYVSDNFESASKKLDFEINCFVADLDVKYL